MTIISSFNERYFAALLLLSLLIVGCGTGNTFSSSEPQADTSRQGAVQISMQRPFRTMPDHPVCFNVNTLIVDQWDNPGLLAAAKKLNIDLLRIPGGTVANYWDWKRGGIQVAQGSRSAMPKQFRQARIARYQSGKIENYSALFEATGADGILVLNMLTSNIKDQMEFIGKAIDRGLPIKYVELGNEFYGDQPLYRRTFPSAESYAQAATKWADAIHKRFPDLKIGIVGVNPRIGNSKGELRLTKWNRILIEESLPHADALTLHEYQNRKGLRNISRPDEVDRLFNGLFVSSGELLDEATGPGFPAGKELWVTEYNLLTGKRDASIAGRWIHGLYAATMAAVFLEEPGISIACNHVLVGNSSFGAILADEKVMGSEIFPSSAKRPANGRARSVSPYTLSATGRALALYSRAVKDKRRAGKLHFSNSPNGTKRHGLYGWVFEKDGIQKDAFLLNLSVDPVALTIPDFFPDVPLKYEQLSAEPDLLVASDADLKELSGTIQRLIELPPYSVTRIYSR